MLDCDSDMLSGRIPTYPHIVCTDVDEHDVDVKRWQVDRRSRVKIGDRGYHLSFLLRCEGLRMEVYSPERHAGGSALP